MGNFKSPRIFYIRLRHFFPAAAFIFAMAVKSLLSIVTPLNGDFINWAHMASFKALKLKYMGPYTFPAYILNLFYRFWLLLPIDHLDPRKMLNHGVFRPSISAYTYVFTFKLPMIIFDLLTAVLIYKVLIHLTGSKRSSLVGYYLWLFNPYLLIAVEMSGEIDVIPAFLVMLSFLLFCRKRLVMSGLVLALATLIRMYPLLFFPLMLIKARMGPKRSLARFSVAYLAGILMVLTPFIHRFKIGIIYHIWRLPLYGKEELSWWLLEPALSSYLPETDISLLALIYLLVTAIWLNLPRIDDSSLLDSMHMVLLPYFAFSYWNEEFILWITPLITVDYVLNKDRMGRAAYSITFIAYFLSLSAYIGIRWWLPRQLFFDPTIPVLNQLREVIAGFNHQIRFQDVKEVLYMISRSILAGASTIIIVGILKRNIKLILSRIIHYIHGMG